jgi:cellulose synthase/poly-beta-1,6-N-acetylglucosamine synthase-like glycosyltransferase
VPLEGAEEDLRENLAALVSLDYPDYELIVAVRTARTIPPAVLPSRVIVVLGGAREMGGSDRIKNLSAGVRVSRKRTQIFAFATGEGRVSKNWLRALAAPLADPDVAASTGYCWYTPEPPDFWSLMRGVWDAVAAGTLGAGDNRFAWGGAMAMRKELFFEAGVPEFWRGELTDDYTLSEAVHAAGLQIAYAPGALTPCVEHTPAGSFLRWIRRQMAITRIYVPRLWWPALIAHIFYCGGMAASAIASINGSRLAEWALIAQLSPGMLKGLNRATLAKAALPEYESWFKRHAWVHAIWVPLGTWVWLIALVSSAIGNSIEWRGRRYALKRRQR